MAELLPGQLSELIDKGDEAGVRALFESLSESDRTHAAARLPSDELGRLLDILGSEAAAGLIEILPLSQAAAAIEEVAPKAAAEILEELASDALVFRYRVGEAADDGLGASDGTFSVCSFWFVECLARAGQVERARLLFEKMLGYANHLGLYSEELGHHGEHLGNFPQAFTHLGLISAAYALDRELSDAGWRDGRAGD